MIGFVIGLTVVTYAVFNEWNAVTLLFLLVTQSVFIGIFDTLRFIVKALISRSYIGFLHALFYTGHFLLLHVLVFIGVLLAEDHLISEFQLPDKIVPAGFPIIALGLFVAQLVVFVNSIRDTAKLRDAPYSTMHIRNYTQHILLFGFVFTVVTGLIDPGDDGRPIPNSAILIAFYGTLLLFEFIASCVRIYPNSPDKLRKMGYTTDNLS
jgi:hypothetical protein